MDDTTLKVSIAATKAAIVAYEAAILALGVGGVQQYTLDTGQSRQTVTKLNLKELNDTLGGLYNRCATLQARLDGSGTTRGRPAW